MFVEKAFKGFRSLLLPQTLQEPTRTVPEEQRIYPGDENSFMDSLPVKPRDSQADDQEERVAKLKFIRAERTNRQVHGPNVTRVEL